MKTNYLLIIFLLCAFTTLKAQQVGINTNAPNPLAVLDIQNAMNETGELNPQGIMIPRLTTIQRDAIDVANAESANSLLIYNTDEDCFNFYSRTEKAWKSLCGDSTGTAIIISADCDNFSINGTFTAGQSLDSSHYLSLPVVVAKAGTYEISAMAETSNGYFFYKSSAFLATGSTVLRIQGEGTPISAGRDIVTVYINGVEYCSMEIEINSSQKEADYSVDCSNAQVLGTYKAGVPLSENNMIELTLVANNESIGSTYDIATTTVNGYSFSAKGVISQNTQKIVLYGTGTPFLSGEDELEITTTNSVSEVFAPCSFSVKVATRAITIVGIGENNTYYMGASTNGMYRLLNNATLFGANQTATYPVGGFKILTPGAGNYVNLASIITNNKPDIIVVQYNWIITTSWETQMAALVSFVNNGGVLIFCSDGDASTSSRNQRSAALIRAIFNTDATYFIPTSSDNTNTFAFDDASPVIDGRFMDLTGKAMARDAGSNFYITNLSEDAQVIAWKDSNKEAARAFMHRDKGFIFFGDGAPFAYAAGNTEPYTYPMKLDSSYKPAINTNSDPDTYNAHLFCNIIAWAVDYVLNDEQ